MGMTVIALLLFVLLLTLYFVYQYMQLSSGAAEIKKDIDTAIKLVGYREGNAENFHRDYEEINENFKDINCLAHAWQEFSEHIIFDKDAKGKLIVKNSIQPSAYFRTDRLLPQNSNIKHSSQVVWNMLAFGIVGAIIVAIVAMASGGALPNQVMALMTIAKHLSYALVCVAAGIGYAAAFSMLQKTDLSHIEEKLHEFNHNLERALVFHTPSQILDEVLDTLVEQNKKIDGISNHIALNSRNVIESHLTREQQYAELLQKFSENIAAKLEQLLVQGYEHVAGVTALKITASEHGQKLADKLDYLFKKLGQHLTDTLIVDALAQLRQHHSTNNDKLHDEFQQLFTQLEHHITMSLERMITANTEDTEKLAAKLETLSAASEEYDYEIQATIQKQPTASPSPSPPYKGNSKIDRKDDTKEVETLIPFEPVS